MDNPVEDPTPPKAYLPLTEGQKVEILCRKSQGQGMRAIARDMKRNESTIRTFIKTWKDKGELFPKRGRHKKFGMSIQIAQVLETDPRLSLRDQSATEALGVKALWSYRHDKGYHFYKEIKITPLTEQHKENRANFCRIHIAEPLREAIIFSDESTVAQNLSRGGLWHKRGQHPPECFAPTEAHPRQVMVWGAIGRGGFRSPLIWVQGSMTGDSYLQMFSEHNLIQIFEEQYGQGGFVFQEDNARPHTCVRQYLEQHMKILDWPARSPDLSPIEQVWAYMKRRIRGRTFQSDEELFAALERIWRAIPNKVIDNYVTSFLARCIVCERLRGASLNGHWTQVNKEHRKLVDQATARANE